jgi:hypothetical protein
MTRQAIIETIDFRLQRRFPKPFIESSMDFIWEQLCDILIKQNDVFYYTQKYEDVTVTLDAVTDRYYSDLPATVVRDGVVRVYGKTSRDLDFIQIPERDFRLMGLQEVYDISQKVYFYVNYNRVFFDDNMTSIVANEGVSMDLLTTLSDFLISADIPLPKVNNVSFIDAVIDYLQGTPTIELKDVNTKK